MCLLVRRVLNSLFFQFSSWRLERWSNTVFRVSRITRIIVHLTTEEAARAESGNFLLVNPSDDVHSEKHRIKVCAIAAKSLRPKRNKEDQQNSKDTM